MNDGVGFWRKRWMPWICAKRLFGPEIFSEGSVPSGEQHDGLRALSLVRTVVGIMISVLISDHFRAGDQETSGWVSNIVFTIFISIGLTLCLTIFLAVRTKENSREALQPVARAVLALLVLGGFWLLDTLRYRYTLPGMAAGIAFLWYVPFAYTSMVYWYLYPFGSSRRFPLLGPAVTGVTVFAVTMISFAEGDSGPLPVLVWIGMNLAGLLTSLTLVAVEVHLLRRDQGDAASNPEAKQEDLQHHRNPAWFDARPKG